MSNETHTCTCKKHYKTIIRERKIRLTNHLCACCKKPDRHAFLKVKGKFYCNTCYPALIIWGIEKFKKKGK